MTRGDRDASAAGVEAFGEFVRKRVELERAAAAEEGARQRLVDAYEFQIDRRRARWSSRGVRWWRWGLAATLAVAVAGGVGTFVHHHQSPITYEATGALGAGGVVTSGDFGAARLDFSDGSRIELLRGAAATVTFARRDGATVDIDGGATSVVIPELESSSWRVILGPYSIDTGHVDLRATWSELDRRLAVDVMVGKAAIQGPLLPEGTALRAGQRVTADLARRVVHIEELGGGAEQSSRGPAPDAPAESWPGLVASGNFDAVVASASVGSLREVLDTRPLADLRALGQASLYVGETELATKALEAQRRRFPQTRESEEAAFLLGMGEDARGNPIKAVHWYRVYRQEAPEGVFAGDALGREFLALWAAGDRAGAKRAAGEYLSRYPGGGHEEAARKLVR